MADAQVRNALILQGSYTLGVSASIVEEMTDWFEPDTEALEGLLDVDLRAWREAFGLGHTFATIERDDLEAVRAYGSEHGGEISYAGYTLREI